MESVGSMDPARQIHTHLLYISTIYNIHSAFILREDVAYLSIICLGYKYVNIWSSGLILAALKLSFIMIIIW